MARPNKLTRDVQQQIVAAVRQGSYPERAAELAGVATATFFRWLARGRAAQRGIYRELFEALSRAETHAEIEMTLRVRKRAKSSALTTLRLLERRFPERWSPYRKLALAEATAAPSGLVVVTAEQLEAFLARAGKASVASTPPVSTSDGATESASADCGGAP